MSTEVKMQMAKAAGMSEAGAVKAAMKTPKGDGLVDMKLPKRTKEDMKKDSIACCGPYGTDEKYPYGLTLRLDNDTMTKLGIPLPDAGTELSITAKATVVESSSRDSTDGKKLSCELQITKLKVG